LEPKNWTSSYATLNHTLLKGTLICSVAALSPNVTIFSLLEQFEDPFLFAFLSAYYVI
jgi:hypothetical protein